jgi:phenol 2-monooxygenase (NADPH)
MENMKDTAWDFSLVLRQKYQEEIFRNAMKKYGIVIEAPVELKAVQVDESVGPGKHRITATVLDGTQKESTIMCKYLIGSDGGRSSVRRLLEIPFDGAMSEDRWVRVDGLVKSNVPKPRTYCAIESPTHGNVLWVGLDRGATRIGYAFTADRAKAYDVFDEAAAVKEAIASVKPFDVEFERVDWWTVSHTLRLRDMILTSSRYTL